MPSQSLYESRFEHDACGVGFIAHVGGDATHKIVSDGLDILRRLAHRGASGADPETGDGAGILVQVPDAFFRSVLPFELPPVGDYGAGMLFIPKESSVECRTMFEESLARVGLRLLGWRRVPTRPEVIGEAAKSAEPETWQVFAAGDESGDALDRSLYVARRLTERAVAESGLPGFKRFHVVSLATRTIVYKGLFTVDQVDAYYVDLADPRFTSAVALVHSRFSTNTLPSWQRAHPFRLLSHNGEINTLRGNVNWMRAREALFATDLFGEHLSEITPVLTPGGSDSQILDNALEILRLSGRSLPHAVMMLIPEAWEHHTTMDADRRAFYEYSACLMEPWDGPATVVCTDGRYVCAALDRNGLRPGRFVITHDGYVVMASEAGVVDFDPANIKEKGRLQPGRMLLVDLDEGRVVDDDEIKHRVATSRPYRQWVDENRTYMSSLPEIPSIPELPEDEIPTQQRLFGYTEESVRVLMAPMAEKGKERIVSMGRDIPVAVLSDQPRQLFDYFNQLFAQVTNPPLDAIREKLVTSLLTTIGGSGNLFDESPRHAKLIQLPHPVLSNVDMARLRASRRMCTVSTHYDPATGGAGLRKALHALCESVVEQIEAGCRCIVLSDRGAGPGKAPIPSLMAVGAVHQHVISCGRRMRASLIVESGEPHEVHHLCTLIGYGATAVNPYLALDTVAQRARAGKLTVRAPGQAIEHFVTALCDGLLKVMSKMGISTLQSYRGAQIFEALGLSDEVVDPCFTGTVSRIGGLDFDGVADEYARFHEIAYPEAAPSTVRTLPTGGRYAWRRDGEHHVLGPMTVSGLQQAVRKNDPRSYAAYAEAVNDQAKRLGTLRGLLRLDRESCTPIPVSEVEPWTEIVQRFKTGAMSYGSISQEAHETLAVAMNAIGGRSNTGEGGEPPERYDRSHPARSRIKQVASGRFGVTISYLASADEIQIKMAQGAKPGEGGQLPGEKVYPWIAKTRLSTPYVGLISPPPHHDIYSIEDLAQLIHDLKNANPEARISVKLVSEAGVGTVAAGVTKARADVVLISGHDGGTGAAAGTSVMHAGLPWELGLAETHQTLVRNGLRRRVRIECDGQLKTGRDVAVAMLLGAEEFGFATAPLVAMGCVMMRKCHLNTCPVGIATQNPELRKLFSGRPEHVINYFHFVAEELREIMASLGCRTVDEMVGRVDLLRQRTDVTHRKAALVDLSRVLAVPRKHATLSGFDVRETGDDLSDALDHALIESAAPALLDGLPVDFDVSVRNADRTTGTLLSHQIVTRYGPKGLPHDHITIRATGSAGQSFGAFGAPGLTLKLRGETNDYLGKGLSGARLVIMPPLNPGFRPHEQIIVGNVALYGATSGDAFIRGRAGERFAVRNSGARAVVEGVGDHGCEYMTGGHVVILGPTGRNFAAGMSGGVAYVLDGTQDFRSGRCDLNLVDVEPLVEPDDVALVRTLVETHLRYTESSVAAWVIDNWEAAVREFVRVIPREYRNALARMAQEEALAA